MHRFVPLALLAATSAHAHPGHIDQSIHATEWAIALAALTLLAVGGWALQRALRRRRG